jgi:hypothetical protein
MNNQLLDKFGELLIKKVRDKAINDWERLISGEMKGTTAERVKQQIANFTPEQVDALSKFVPLIVDAALHHLLFTAEQERGLQLIMNNPEGGVAQNLREISDGLSGELYGKHGWIARFSEKPK